MSQNQQCDPTQQADIDAAESCADHASLMHSLEEKLIIAICDAHMRKHDYRIEGDHYLYSPTYPPMVPKHISRPSENGKGGGVFSSPFHPGSEKESTFAQDFNYFRARISGILATFDSLPTGTEMSTGRTAILGWSKDLHPDKNQNTIGLPADIETAGQDLTKSTSETIDYVNNHMLGKVLPATTILHEATLGALSLMDKNIQAINRMRHDTRAAIQAAIDSANTMASNAFHAEFKTLLKALSFGADVGSLLKGDVSAGVSAAEGIEGWVTTNEENQTISGEHFTPDGILDALESTLASINDNLRKAENSIVSCFNSIEAQLQIFYSNGTTTVDQSELPKNTITAPSTVTIDWTALSRAYDSDLPKVAQSLRTAKSNGYHIRYTTALSRFPSIGRGFGGSDNGFYCVLHTIQDSLERLAESCEGIAQGLKDFENDFKATETESQDSLNNIARTIQRYSFTTPKFRQEQVDQPPQKK